MFPAVKKKKYSAIMRFWRKKPTSVEVIEAIFDLFTPEEMEAMRYDDEVLGYPDVGIKQSMLDLSHKIKPKYSIERSVEIAREVVAPVRSELSDPKTRPFIYKEFITTLFS